MGYVQRRRGGEENPRLAKLLGSNTCTIGMMVLIHGDHQGLVLPPKVGNVQAVIVSCEVTTKTSG